MPKNYSNSKKMNAINGPVKFKLCEGLNFLSATFEAMNDVT
jgi:hypothetical protein